MKYRIGLALLLLLPLGLNAAPQPAFDSGLAGFSVNVHGLDVAYREFPLFAMPGEAVPITADPASHYRLTAAGGEWREAEGNHWTWQAPLQPGHYRLDVRRDDGAAMQLEAFVMTPAAAVHHGQLNGYNIGQYPHAPLHGLAVYRAPTGFVEVTPALAALHITPHFTLGEFLCKEAGGFPKYLVLRPLLLLKLETLAAYLGARGVPAEAIHVMSGYRTPWYNRQLGDTAYSRHMWGDAADIYLDAGAAPGTASGAIAALKDSRQLAAGLSRLFQQPAYAYLLGGLGTYAATRDHPPFVHVDARGFQARW